MPRGAASPSPSQIAGLVPETDALKSKPARLMTDRILIFSDHRGSERFFLRFGGTAGELKFGSSAGLIDPKEKRTGPPSPGNIVGCPELRFLSELPRRGYRWSAQGFSPGSDNRQLERSTVKSLLQKLPNILLVSCCFAIAACVNQPANGPVSQAQISLNQARSQADAKTAIGYYLDAADSALNSAKRSSNTSSADSQAIYNSACQEMAVLLKANPALWNRPISTDDHIYRLQFTSGSRQIR
jgi:hypothetical protein